MRGIIVQDAEIFDPSALPEYIDAVRKFHAVLLFKVEPEKGPKARELKLKIYQDQARRESIEGIFKTKLPPMEEIDRFYDGTAMGKLLYPHTVAYLKPLNISQISDLQDWHSHREINGNVKTLDDLQANVERMATSWPFFGAVINPPVPVGSNEVKIEMHYSSGDDYYAEKGGARSITVSSMYEDPNLARVGLRKLKELFPEMVFKEELFLFQMPEEVRDAFKRENEYFWSLFRQKRKWTDEERKTNDGYNRDKNSKLLHFAMPYLQKLGIHPEQIVYYKDGKKTIPMKTFDTILAYVGSPEYDHPHLPDVHGHFDGRKIEMDFAPVGNWMFNIHDYGVKVENKDVEGTLEHILHSYNSLS